MRRSGILLPITSIPSKYGIGAFSKEAYEFVDFLEAAGQSYWQILPLGPTGYGDSPYQSFSTFAGNPYFIDLEVLIEQGWLTIEECVAVDFGADEKYVDYAKIFQGRFALLWKAFQRSPYVKPEEDMDAFIEACKEWLPDYALYMAVKNHYDGKSWIEWEEDIKLRKPDAINTYKEGFAEEIRFYEFQQFLFQKQWSLLKKYANDKKIEIIGDIPIYVAFDSADTWANPELFQLDENSTPIAVAGCPPDAFSATGQLWGNPLYRWDYHAETNYSWWMKRIAYCYELYDVVRIDHFRGFDEYYSIPYGDPTAEFGHWEKGPGYDIFSVLKTTLGKKNIIAEDLGYLTPTVIKLVKETGYPGMKVLQFAFDSREESDYLPHNYDHNCVVYTGTHDNDTTHNWYQVISNEDRKLAKAYLNLHNSKDVSWELIRSALASVADTAVIPIQDYLGLGKEARINTPSTLGFNWRWRLISGQLTKELAEKIRAFVKLYGRY